MGIVMLPIPELERITRQHGEELQQAMTARFGLAVAENRLSRTDPENVKTVRRIIQENENGEGTLANLCARHGMDLETFRTYRRRYRHRGLLD